MVVVTGGTGYIGSHTVVELINNGYEVVILDNLSNSHLDVLDYIEEITSKRPTFFQVDVDDRNQLNTVFAELGTSVEAIIHFAAKKAVGESVQEPLMYYRNNVGSLVNILEQTQKHGISKFVFSSSCTVYGQPDVCPVTESTQRKEAESPYGNTKTICEGIIRDCCKVQELTAISLRYFNPIGAHSSGKIGELPVGTPNNLVPYVTQTAAGIRESLTIHGNDYPTLDGTCVRDYIHVVDLAKAHLQALKRLEGSLPKSKYEVYNIGTGDGKSVLQVVDAFIAATGINVPYKIGQRRGGDITEIFADTTLANQALNWKAELSLEDALSSSWNWEKNYRSRKG